MPSVLSPVGAPAVAPAWSPIKPDSNLRNAFRAASRSEGDGS